MAGTRTPNPRRRKPTSNTPAAPTIDRERLTEELNGVIANAVHDVQWPEVVAHIEAHDATPEADRPEGFKPLGWVIETLTSDEDLIGRAKSIRTAGMIAYGIAEAIDLRHWRDSVMAMDGIDKVKDNAAEVLADPGDLSDAQKRNSLRWALGVAEGVIGSTTEGDVADHQVQTVKAWLEDDAYGAFEEAGANLTVNLGLKMETIENLGLTPLVTEIPDNRPGREGQTKKMVRFFDLLDAVAANDELLKVRNIRHSVLFACTLYWENLRQAGFGENDPEQELVKLLIAANQVVAPQKVDRLEKMLKGSSRGNGQQEGGRAKAEAARKARAKQRGLDEYANRMAHPERNRGYVKEGSGKDARPRAKK